MVPAMKVMVPAQAILNKNPVRHSNVSLENEKKLCVHCPVPKENHANAKVSAS